MPNPRPVKPPSHAHNNADLLVWTCYSAGGFERWLDVEDLYLKAFELGPNRLGWRTRSDIPDYKKCAKALQELEDINRSDHIGLILKNGRYTRKLSETGLEWCVKHRELLESLYAGGNVPAQEGSDAYRIIKQVDRSQAFADFASTGKVSVELWVLADALKCLPDASKAVWLSRIDVLRASAETHSRTDLFDFAVKVRTRVESELGS